MRTTDRGNVSEFGLAVGSLAGTCNLPLHEAGFGIDQSGNVLVSEFTVIHGETSQGCPSGGRSDTSKIPVSTGSENADSVCGWKSTDAVRAPELAFRIAMICDEVSVTSPILGVAAIVAACDHDRTDESVIFPRISEYPGT